MFYIKVDKDNVIIDALSYPYSDYVPVDVDYLPTGVMGGWFKLEGGQIVEYPELKPVDNEIQKLRNDLDNAILELTMAISMQGGSQ